MLSRKTSCLGVAMFAVAASVLGTSQRAFANTTSYTQYQIGSGTGSETVSGEYANGNTLVYDAPTQTYTTYDHGVGTVVTSPSMSFDNGSACSVSYSGSSYRGLCNGGYEAFNMQTTAGSNLYAGLTGQLGLIDISSIGGIDRFFLNASGDLAYDDVGREDLYQAYPTATPEPGTWVLMLTGAGLMFATHRRLVA